MPTWLAKLGENLLLYVAGKWQSEYLQFLGFILLTVLPLQKGSPESKPLGKAGRGSDKDQKVGPYALPD